MNRILNKSKTWLLRRPTPATSNQFQTNLTHLHHPPPRHYSISSQFSKPADDLQSEAWRSMEGLVKCSANYAPLSPISFLERSADVYRDRTSVIYGSLKYTWEETHRRCVKLASALTQLGISRGDVLATLAPNVPAMQELHFAVPMAGAVLCTLNIRHDSNMLATLLTHSETKILVVDHQLLDLALPAINLLKKPPVIVIISDAGVLPPLNLTTNTYDYESLVESGTTGFMYGMGVTPTYLWSSPMFHCNGWSLIWGLAAVGGTNICLRRCDPKDVFDNIVNHKVTHMGGASTVLNMILNCPVSDQKPLPHKVGVMTGGAPPPPLIISKMEELGFRVCHVYGLTETYGPSTTCLWKPEWDSLPVEERLKLKARQGVRHLGLEGVDVKDPVTMDSVKSDGKSMGEVMFRGNTVMSGYLKDRKATEEAFSGGWFRSGDLAVKHPDGYIEVKDRSKDIIISGGENISTVEVETVIYSHPAVLEVAVVARPDNHWGQTPCAFVKLKDGFNVDGEDIIKYCREHMPRYMAPKTVIFDELPRNSTGKVQKFLLREKAKALGSIS